jgi:glycosyltransferase involved in cell wall biosynthesis
MGGIEVYRFPYSLPRSSQRLCYGSGIETNVKQRRWASMQVPLYWLSQLLALVWVSRRLDVDAVNSHWLLTQGLNAALTRKWLKLPHVCTVHSGGLFVLRGIPGGSRIAEFITRHSDHIFAVSSHIKDRLDALVQEETIAEVLPMGVEFHRFARAASESPGQPHTLLFVGRLTEVKGLEYLIDAMPRIVRVFPGTQLMVVGDGPLRHALRDRVDGLGVKEHIRFLGRRTSTEMPSIYAQSSVVVVPSIVSGAERTEGMPVVVLEALAAGKPVVASKVSGIPDVVVNGVNGFLAEPESSDDLADRVLETLQRLSRSSRLRCGAQATARRYDWKVISQRYAEVLREAAKNARRE